MDSGTTINKIEAKKRYLKRYSDKKNVLNKWIALNKKLSPNKEFTYYSSLVVEACGLVEYIVDVKLQDNPKINIYEDRYKDTGNTVKFYSKINLLRKSGLNISQLDEDRIREIKQYRNMFAHNTESCIGAMIDYHKTKEYFKTMGEVLYKLEALDEEYIVLDSSLFVANEGDTIEEVYVLDKFIGEGGTSRVFKGYHKRLGIPVAIKEIKHDIVDYDVINNEKKMLLSLNYPGIPRIYDIVEYGGTHYLIMDYIEGDTLENTIKNLWPMSNNAIVDIEKQLSDIINYLHDRGILYNDLKPNNIIINKFNKVFLIDFGISNSIEASQVKGIYQGTYKYSSPEQLNGQGIDVRSDIYALGATLYYMVEGEHPSIGEEQRFRGSTDSILKHIISKSMSVDIENRYRTVEEFINDLDNASSKDKENVVVINEQVATDGDFKEKVKDTEGKANVIVSKKDSKKKIIIGLVAVAIVVLALVLNLGDKDTGEDNNEQGNTTQVTDNNGVGENDLQNPTNSENLQGEIGEGNSDSSGNEAGLGEEVVDAPTQQDNLETSNSVFGGDFVTTLNSYDINGENLSVTVTINNNYDKEINMWVDGIYVINGDGKRFPLDNFKHLSKGENKFNVMSGETREFTFYFTGYSESSELTLKLEKLWCMGPEAMKEVVELKFK